MKSINYTESNQKEQRSHVGLRQLFAFAVTFDGLTDCIDTFDCKTTRNITTTFIVSHAVYFHQL